MRKAVRKAAQGLESKTAKSPRKLLNGKLTVMVIFACYMLLNLYLMIRHNMWRDEVNVWLMGRDLTIPELFREIRYQGHPVLWYLVVMPFAKLHLPCKTMCVLSFAAMSAAAGIFLFKGPFPTAVKAAAVFSPIFTYYYAVIARGYCLVALLIILLAFLYRIRNEKPLLYGGLLFLLVQADTIGVPVAGMISLMWLGQSLFRFKIPGKKASELKTSDSGTADKMSSAKAEAAGTASDIQAALKGLWLPLLSVALYLLEMKGAGEGSTAFEIRDYGLSDTIIKCRDFAYYIPQRLFGLGRGAAFWIGAALVVFILILSFYARSLWPLIVFGAVFAFQVIFSVIVYELNIWHFLTLCFVFIFMMWVCELPLGERYTGKLTAQDAKQDVKQDAKQNTEQNIEQNTEQNTKRYLHGIGLYKGVRVLLSCLCFALCVLCLIRWFGDEGSGPENAFFGSYSDGAQAARFLRQNVSEQELIVVNNIPYTTPIYAYADQYLFRFAGNGREVSYADWTEDQCRQISFRDLLEQIRGEQPDRDSFIYIAAIDSFVTEEDDYLAEAELIYETTELSPQNENYRIYRVKLPDF